MTDSLALNDNVEITFSNRSTKLTNSNFSSSQKLAKVVSIIPFIFDTTVVRLSLSKANGQLKHIWCRDPAFHC